MMKRNENVEIALMVLEINEFQELKTKLSPLRTHVLDCCFEALKRQQSHIFFDDIQHKIAKSTKEKVEMSQIQQA